MNLVDSSGWIEYFTDNPHAARFEKYLLQSDSLLVPTLVLYEVYRQLIKKVDEKEALFAVTQMEKGKVVPLDQYLSLFSAEISLKHKLGTADSVIYATALFHKAKLITLDNDFRALPECLVIE
jgi:predicted nucleic acid-binding protein